MLSAESVDVAVGHKPTRRCPLLQGVNLTVKPGAVVAVVGPNGAGKTSLLRVLTGEMLPIQGQVLLQGRPLSDWPAAQRAQRLGVLPQQSALSFPFQVNEVVALGRYPHKTGARRDREIVEQALAAVDGAHLKSRAYTTLSGGEKQRVHLARVLAQVWEPPVEGERYLLLDEPTSALDLAHQHLILDTARQMARQGAGVLVILHDLNLAAHYADWVVMIKQGRLVATGDAHVVLTPAHIQAVFGVAVAVMPHPQTGRPLVVHQDGKLAAGALDNVFSAPGVAGRTE